MNFFFTHCYIIYVGSWKGGGGRGDWNSTTKLLKIGLGHRPSGMQNNTPRSFPTISHSGSTHVNNTSIYFCNILKTKKKVKQVVIARFIKSCNSEVLCFHITSIYVYIFTPCAYLYLKVLCHDADIGFLFL